MCSNVAEERKTASVQSEAERTLSAWSRYFKENHSLARQMTTFCLVLQSRHMFAYASPWPASFVFACRCGRTLTEKRKTASVWSEAEQTLSAWSRYFKENHSLSRRMTTFCLMLQSRHMFTYALPWPASFLFACRCGRTLIEKRKTASVRSQAEQTLSTWSRYFKENHSLSRRMTTFCLVLQSRHMFAYASPHLPRLCSRADVDAP